MARWQTSQIVKWSSSKGALVPEECTRRWFQKSYSTLLTKQPRGGKEMKKTVTFIIIAMLSLGFVTSTVHAYATKMYVTPATVIAGKIGKIFTVSVATSGVVNLYGFEFKLAYNSTLLDALNVTLDTHFFSGQSYVLKNFIDHSAGYIWFAATLLAPEPPKIGNGVLATITFNVTYSTIYPQTEDCDLHLYADTLGDNTGQPIAHDTIDGYYTFAPILGDINGDGTVDIFDIVIIATAFGASPSDPNWDPRADLNGNSFVDILDAVMLAVNFGMTG